MNLAHLPPYKRPGMYIGGMYNGKWSAANLYGSFLRDILYSDNPNDFTYIDIISNEQNYSITAYGRVITLPDPVVTLSDIFDVKNLEQAVISGAKSHSHEVLGWFPLIVWFSEYCLVEMRTTQGHYRQMFLNGTSLHPQTEVLASNQSGQSIGFHFTLLTHTNIFNAHSLDVPTLKLAIQDVKNWIYPWAKRENKKLPKLKLRWHVRSEYCHSLRIELIPAN